ncbi:uncharacterized protein ACA1_152770 [Acanthamoeba castellanii str. Neff]|uniref:Uncharacterized protein n=1 Tax=Acanthamoeba castellanii (strain ATCC 30010 / Neff) TaxID=1257118 RepID=L8HHD6_ACACF|nr:uncharacterized protein ACA1_152770 [Acanthamoeba castellanii str. Neff]ELR24088.1 hypothetical protein ACA1_152770 [Acanthamoeba castellanii str. Neff]
MFMKDYHSSASPWMGPYSFLNLCPSDSPFLFSWLSLIPPSSRIPSLPSLSSTMPRP